ncbi:MAG TPA: four helix bundle protein [Candidatus Peribacteraceae bacterium]|nr:four helix bundle protein [Candidatus Peribacteraceae bacterium]
MGFQSFEDIHAWQETRNFLGWLRIVCERPNVRRDWSWIDQIRRATLSIMSNIAEGNDAQTNAEFVQFLGYAKRSANEARSQLYYALDAGYVSQEEWQTWVDVTKKIASQLHNLIRYLRMHSDDPRSLGYKQSAPQLTCNVQRATNEWESEKDNILASII